MATTTLPRGSEWTVADLLRRFGPIPHWRIRRDPPPGKATIRDVVRILDHEDRACELVDGILVEKTVGVYESCLASVIAGFLRDFVRPRNLGFISGEAGPMELLADLVRIPDVASVAWDRFPGREIPREPVPRLAPDLAVEVLSKGNTKKEMDEKLANYFEAGVRLVWYVDPVKRTVKVHNGPGRGRLLHEDETLDGGDVLPGFVLPIRDIFNDPTLARVEA